MEASLVLSEVKWAETVSYGLDLDLGHLLIEIRCARMLALFSAHWLLTGCALLVEEPLDIENDQQPILEPGKARNVLMRD